jgi:uncharacterized membrane protein YvlD (DUF360 family)
LGISWLTNALVLAVVAASLSGVHVSSAGTLLAAAAVFGLLNTILKPMAVNMALDHLPGPWQITGHRRRRRPRGTPGT